MSPDPIQAWLGAARDPRIRADLEAIYADIASQIEARSPACWASGRCCNFEASGHFLYVTGLEAAYSVVRHGENHPSAIIPPSGRGDPCPFQSANLCTAHTIKPLGCRVYFCDRSAQEWQHKLSEHGLAQIRALHDAHHLEYRYAEWRALLTEIAAASEPPAISQ
jgi:Fe-S-cluster containining protein